MNAQVGQFEHLCAKMFKSSSHATLLFGEEIMNENKKIEWHCWTFRVPVPCATWGSWRPIPDVSLGQNRNAHLTWPYVFTNRISTVSGSHLVVNYPLVSFRWVITHPSYCCGRLAPTKIPLKSPGWPGPHKNDPWVVRHQVVDFRVSQPSQPSQPPGPRSHFST